MVADWKDPHTEDDAVSNYFAMADPTHAIDVPCLPAHLSACLLAWRPCWLWLAQVERKVSARGKPTSNACT
jgi:hypothetical protein